MAITQASGFTIKLNGYSEKRKSNKEGRVEGRKKRGREVGGRKVERE